MRILFIHTFYYPEILGGAEYSVKKLAEGLVKAGHDVYVLCSGKENSRETIEGVKVIRYKTFIRRDKKYNIVSRIKRIASETNNIFDKKEIQEIIKEVKPNVIHTNCLYHFSTAVWKYAKERQIRIVHTIRDYYLSCYRIGWQCDNCSFPKPICQAYRLSTKRASRLVDFVTAPSKYTLDRSIEDGLFRNAKAISIPNATDFVIDKVKASCNYHKNKTIEQFRYIYLGALDEKKGVKWLVEVFSDATSKLNNISLYIAGKGTLQSFVEEMCLKHKNIHYLGFLTEQEVEQEVQASDALVAPSLWEEPFGRIVLDAYKQGIPVVACKSGGLQDIVDDEETGLLVDPYDSEMLENALYRLSNDHDLYMRCCENIPNKLENYSVDEQVRRFLSVYKE